MKREYRDALLTVIVLSAIIPVSDGLAEFDEEINTNENFTALCQETLGPEYEHSGGWAALDEGQLSHIHCEKQGVYLTNKDAVWITDDGTVVGPRLLINASELSVQPNG